MKTDSRKDDLAEIRLGEDAVARRPRATGMPAAGALGGVLEDALSDHSAATLGGSYLTAEISAGALRHNFKLIRDNISPGTSVCTVVKGNGYGHGLATTLGLLEELTDCFGVATPEEAIVLRQLGCLRPILMFLPACGWASGQELRQALDRLIVENVILTIVDTDEVRAVAEAARRVGCQAEAHVMVDTGMGRGGVPLPEAAELIRMVRSEGFIRMTGAYTHFAVADEGDLDFTRQQLRLLLDVVEQSGGRKGLTLHAANSAGLIQLPETHLDMVRPGIAVYGYQPADTLRTVWPLKPILRLTGQLMHIMTVKAGSRCGYGLSYRFERDTPVGLVPVGYADGYMRRLSDRTTMRIRGRNVRTRGRVSMDQVVVDLSEVPDARVGDEVEIISADPTSPHSVENLARLAETVPYEITCRLGRRVRRMLVD